MRNIKSIIAAVIFCAAVLLHTTTAHSAPGWTAIGDTDLDLIYIRQGAALSHFDSVIIDPLNVWHAQGNDEDSRDSISRLQKQFADQFTGNFEDNGFTVVEKATKSTLRLHVELIDLKLNAPLVDANQLRSRFQFEVQPGKMTLVAEIQNSMTGEVLLRIADIESDPVDANTLWDEAVSAFDSWSLTLGETMRDLGVSPKHTLKLAKLQN